jgi:chorismate mutase-like protein
VAVTSLLLILLTWTANQSSPVSLARAAESEPTVRAGPSPSLPLDQESMESLAKYRRQIDSLDDRLLKLLNERAEVVKKVGLIKEKHHLPIRVAKREEEVIKRLQDQNPGPLPSAAIRHLWERIIEEMRAVEASK